MAQRDVVRRDCRVRRRTRTVPCPRMAPMTSGRAEHSASGLASVLAICEVPPFHKSAPFRLLSNTASTVGFSPAGGPRSRIRRRGPPAFRAPVVLFALKQRDRGECLLLQQYLERERDTSSVRAGRQVGALRADHW